MSEGKHFEEFTDEQLAVKRLKVQNKNTIKSNNSTSKQFQAYLKQLNQEEDFWEYDAQSLNSYLGKFWFAAQQLKLDKNGQEKKYTVQSLHSLHYGLQRVLKDHNYPHNIITSELFSTSQELFDDACRELKKEGLSNIHHYPEIKPSGNSFKQNFCNTSNRQIS